MKNRRFDLKNAMQVFSGLYSIAAILILAYIVYLDYGVIAGIAVIVPVALSLHAPDIQTMFLKRKMKGKMKK